MGRFSRLVTQCAQALVLVLGFSAFKENEETAASLRAQIFERDGQTVTILSGVRHVYNLGFDSQGRLYLPQFVDGTVLQLSPSLEVMATLCGATGGWHVPPKQCPDADTGLRFQRPHTVASDRSGRLYVAEYRAGRIGQFTEQGELIRYLGSLLDPVSPQGPASVWPEDDGYVFVGDAKVHAVLRYRSDGTFAGWMGAGQDGTVRPGFRFDRVMPAVSAEPGGFNNPHLARYGPDGNLYVADTGNFRIQRFTKDGRFIGWLGGSETGIPAKGWRANGRTKSGTGLGAFANPVSFDFDARANMYIAETDNCRVQKIAPDGKAVSWLGRAQDGTVGWHIDGAGVAGSEPAAFKFPYDVRLLNGRLYVSDTHNGRIQILAGPRALGPGSS